MGSQHSVQLFDTPDSLADAVSAFLQEGASRGERLLAAITPEHWNLVASRLEQQGLAVAAAVTSGRLTLLDAGATLEAITRNKYPDAPQFDAVIGAIARKLAAKGSGLRVYGELVDLLARRGDFRAAHALELLWNRLGEEVAFELFCGYASVSFGHARSSQALYAICRAHDHVRFSPGDDLGAWLVSDATPAGSASSPSPARS